MTSPTEAPTQPVQPENRIEALGPRFIGALGVLGLAETYDLTSPVMRDARRLAFDGLNITRENPLNLAEVQTLSGYVGEAAAGKAQEAGKPITRRDVTTVRIKAIEALGNYSLFRKQDRKTARKASLALMWGHGLQGKVIGATLLRESFRHEYDQ